MGFTIWNILKASLLVANAMAILNHKRVIQKCKLLLNLFVFVFFVNARNDVVFFYSNTDFLGPPQGQPQMDQFGSYVTPPPRAAGLKQIGDLFVAATYLRGMFFRSLSPSLRCPHTTTTTVPLLICNSIVIVVDLVFG